MAETSRQKKFTASEIKAHVQRIQKTIEQHKRENRGEHFTASTPHEIAKKLKRANSPIITDQVWNSTTVGGTVNYGLGIFNPDLKHAALLYAHVWISSVYIDPVVGTFLLTVDPRFRRLTQPEFFGLTLAGGASSMLHYTLNVPSIVEKTNYIGNSWLVQLNSQNCEKCLDRAVFGFTVS
jgi:hypothetical protein